MPGGDCKLDSEYRFAFGRENAVGNPVAVSRYLGSRYSGGVVGSDWCPAALPCSWSIWISASQRRLVCSCSCIAASKRRLDSKIFPNSSFFFSICYTVSGCRSWLSTLVGHGVEAWGTSTLPSLPWGLFK